MNTNRNYRVKIIKINFDIKNVGQLSTEWIIKHYILVLVFTINKVVIQGVNISDRDHIALHFK